GGSRAGPASPALPVSIIETCPSCPEHAMFARARRLAAVLLLPGLLVATAPALASSSEALLRAIVQQQPERVAILLDQGVSPEAASGEGEYRGKTALMWAAETGQVVVLRMLLQYGAVVDRGN